MSKLKVWGGRYWGKGVRGTRAIVCATSKKRAAQIAGTTLYDFNQFWGEIGNEAQIIAGHKMPETLLLATSEIVYLPVDDWHEPRIPK